MPRGMHSMAQTSLVSSSISISEELSQATLFEVLELMRQRLPEYVVNCLVAAGYDVIEVIIQ